MKKVKHHFELAAMTGQELARYVLECIEKNSGNEE
jgi:hypothetical protein